MAPYHALFSKSTTPIEEQRALPEEKRSVLDAVLDNAHSLKRGLSKNDNAKLEEYFQGVREIELRLSTEEQWIGVPQPKSPMAEPKPDFNGKEEVLLIYDLMVAAMRTDSTRVLTFRQPVDTLLKAWDIKVHPHDISHYHTTLGEKLIASQKRYAGLSELLALFLDKLKAVKETDGSRLFDRCALAYGSTLLTGHELSNCPAILSGGVAGLKLGEHIVAPKNTPLCNAWLSMLHGVGVKAERHGDSTGPLEEILA